VSHDLKIIGLLNKDELVEKGPTDNRLYKFELNHKPDGLWVLLLQRAGLQISEVTLSANADQVELWAGAASSLSVKEVLAHAKRAVAQANADASESEALFNKKAQEKADALAAAQASFVSEVDELDFSDSEPVPDPLGDMGTDPLA
jgi:hypothetical protein